MKLLACIAIFALLGGHVAIAQTATTFAPGQSILASGINSAFATKRDSAAAIAAEGAAQSSANTANAALTALNSRVSTTATPNSIPTFGNSGIGPALTVNTPLSFGNITTPTTSILDILNVIKNESGSTDKQNTSTINAQDTTGVSQGGQQATFQALTNCYSTVPADNCLSLNLILRRELNSNSRTWNIVASNGDLTGLDSATAGGTQLLLEGDETASYADDGLNTKVWGGQGDRFAEQLAFSVAPGGTSTIVSGSIVGDMLTLSTSQSFVAGSTIQGQGASVAPNTTILSGSGTAYIIDPPQNVSSEGMAVTPPGAPSVSFTGALVVGTNLNASIDSLLLASAGAAGTGSQIGNFVDCRNVVAPTGSGLTYPRCMIMPANTQIDFDGDGTNTAQFNTPSLLSPPERALSYVSADHALEYFINGAGVALSVFDTGVVGANFGLVLTDNGGASAGHLAAVATNKPTITGCTGCSLDAQASDLAGTLTEGTAQTGAVIAFEHPYATAPHCNVTPISALAASAFTSATPSTTGLAIANGSMSNTGYTYECIQ